MKDMNKCYMCKLSEPHVTIRRSKGKPLGECIPCRNARQTKARNKASLYADFYDRGRKLADWNYNQLVSLPLGTYALINRQTKAKVGYATLLEGRVYTSIWDGEGHLFRQDIYGISTWLSNLGLTIDGPAEALAPPPEAKVENVADSLYMFDQALQDYAVKRVKDELEAVKKKSMALAKK